MANRTRSREKPSQRAAASQKSAPPGQTANGRRVPKLSQADVAELARQMQILDGMLQMLLDRYPELGKPLTRRWALTPRSNAA